MLRKLAASAMLIGLMTTAAMASENLDKPLLTQGGVNVTLGDVDAFMQRFPEERRAGFFASQKRINQMLIGILRNKQLAKQAVEMKLDQDPEVKAEIDFLREDALARARARSYESSLTVPSMALAAKEEYAAHKNEYVIPPDVEVQHVLVSISGRTEADAKALAEKVRGDAVANPSSFDELVRQYSDDQSKTGNDGHIAQAASDKMVPEFAHAAGSLKNPGDISPVVKTKYGFHVLKLVKILPGKTVPYAEVKDKIEAQLKAKYVAEQRKTWMEKLDVGNPQVDPQIMEVLSARYAGDGSPSIEQTVKGKPAN